MIAINWFEVILPVSEAEIPTENFHINQDVPKRRSTISHRTVFRKTDKSKKLYHITTSPPNKAILEKVDFNKDPTIAKYAIEHGFASWLQQQGFDVRLRHVGGMGYKGTEGSALPNVYQSSEGIKFRCFYGFENNERNKRWGLILSYITGQNFVVALDNVQLRELAIGKMIIRIDHNENRTNFTNVPSSGILESAQGSRGTLIDNSGKHHDISLNQWTLSSRRDNLLGFIRLTEGPQKASEISVKLQQDALTLTPERRINTSLAKDQLIKLRHLLQKFALFSFRLALPGQTPVRINQEPLSVE